MDNNELPQRGCVVALAGRRIDADGADLPRFPLANVPLVRKRLTELFVNDRP
jgi:hypothetical protein